MKYILITIYKIFIFIPFFSYFNMTLSNETNDYENWLIDLRKDALSQGISAEIFDKAMFTVEINEKVKKLDIKQPEKTITFNDYLSRSVSSNRIKLGQKLYKEYASELNQIANFYNVQPRFIVAIWGIETNYGSYTGNFPVISALTSLSFKGRRASFFRKQLIAALHILNDGDITLEEMTGSWAGAMGQSQFMPTSYLEYAQDFNNDGKKDIWNDQLDIFASIAYYLKRHGWDNTRTWGREVSVPDDFFSNDNYKEWKNKSLKFWSEKNIKMKNNSNLPNSLLKANLIIPNKNKSKFFLVYKNFDRIKKYNNSNFYALSVGILSDRIKN